MPELLMGGGTGEWTCRPADRPPGPGGRLRCQRQKTFLPPAGPEVQAAPPSLGAPTCELPKVCGSQNPGSTRLGACWRWEVLGGTAAPCIHGLWKGGDFMSQGRPLLKSRLSCSGPKRGGGLGRERTAWNNAAAQSTGRCASLGWGMAAKMPLSWCFLVATEDQFW